MCRFSGVFLLKLLVVHSCARKREKEGERLTRNERRDEGASAITISSLGPAPHPGVREAWEWQGYAQEG